MAEVTGIQRRPSLLASVVVICLLAIEVAATVRGPVWSVDFTARPGVQQGVATDGRFTWISDDVGGGRATISTYTAGGAYVGTSAPLPLGHAAELDYRVRDGQLYVANGGLSTQRSSAAARVFAVALSAAHIATRVTRTYDFGWLGRNALVAVDNVTDELLVMGGPDGGPWRVAITPFPVAGRTSAATVGQVVRIDDPGVALQGLGSSGGRVTVYVTDRTGRARLDTFQRSGAPVSRELLPFTGEAEGLAIDPLSGAMVLGIREPDRVLRSVPGLRLP